MQILMILLQQQMCCIQADVLQWSLLSEVCGQTINRLVLTNETQARYFRRRDDKINVTVTSEPESSAPRLDHHLILFRFTGRKIIINISLISCYPTNI